MVRSVTEKVSDQPKASASTAQPDPELAKLKKQIDELKAKLEGPWTSEAAKLRTELQTLEAQYQSKAGSNASLDMPEIERRLSKGVGTLSSEERVTMVAALTERHYSVGSKLDPWVFRIGDRPLQIVTSLFADNKGIEFAKALGQSGLAFRLAEQLPAEVLNEDPKLAAKVAQAVVAQLVTLQRILQPNAAGESEQWPSLEQLEALIIKKPALMKHISGEGRFDLLRAIVATAPKHPASDAWRGRLARALVSDLTEAQKHTLSFLASPYLRNIGKYRVILGGKEAARPVEDAIEKYAARDERIRDFDLMRGAARFDQYRTTIAESPRQIAAGAAARASAYVRELDRRYVAVSYEQPPEDVQDLKEITLFLHKTGGTSVPIGKIDMKAPQSQTMEGVIAQIGELVNRLHYAKTPVANAQEKPLPFANALKGKIELQNWTFVHSGGDSAEDIDRRSDSVILSKEDAFSLFKHSRLIAETEKAPAQDADLEKMLGNALKKLGGNPADKNAFKMLNGRVQMDLRIAETLARSPAINLAAPMKLFHMFTKSDKRFAELRPNSDGDGYRFLRLINGTPRFVMPAEAFLLYSGNEAGLMADDHDLPKPATPLRISEHLEKALRDTYNVIPDVSLLATGEIAISPEHWWLLHRALGFDFDYGAEQHTFLNQERTAWLSDVVYEDFFGTKLKGLMASKGFVHEVRLHGDTLKVSGPKEFPMSFSAAQMQPENSGYLTFSMDGAEVLVCSNEKAIFVTIRGTEGREDFVTDFKAGVLSGKAPFSAPGAPKAAAHPGFMGQNLAVRDAVARAIDFFNPGGNKHIVFTGHSKGGAEAVGLAAMMYNGWESPGKSTDGSSNDTPKVTKYVADAVYTYGEARYFNKEAAEWYNNPENPLSKRTFVIQNYTEVVPHVPPRFLDYRHVGTVYFHKPNNFEHFTFGEEPSDWGQEIVKSGIENALAHRMWRYRAIGRSGTAVSTSAKPGEYPLDPKVAPGGKS